MGAGRHRKRPPEIYLVADGARHVFDGERQSRQGEETVRASRLLPVRQEQTQTHDSADGRDDRRSKGIFVMGYHGLSLKNGLRFGTKVTVIDEVSDLVAAIKKANLRNLYKASGIVRTIAIRSIKKAPTRKKLKPQTGEQWERGKDGKFAKGRYEALDGKQRSKPGNPPLHHVHSKQGLRMIWYDIERPESFAPSSLIGPVKFEAAGEDVPHVLEFGGIAVNAKGQKFPMAARPYMRPAEEKARPKYPQFWQDSI
jgi:hypothetical protein